MARYLARHGQDYDNKLGLLNGRRDEALSDLGVEQAFALARGMQTTGIIFDAVYCSPLRRAHATAQIACDALDLPPPKVMQDLVEKDYGTMAGQKICDIKRLCGDAILETNFTIGTNLTYFLDAMGGEDYPQTLLRAHRVWEKVDHLHAPEENVLLVGHGCMGKMLFAAYHGMDWKDCLQHFHFGNTDLLELSKERGIENPYVLQFEQYNH